MYLPRGSEFKKTQSVFSILNQLPKLGGRNSFSFFLSLSLFILSTCSFLAFASEKIHSSSGNGIGEEKLNLLLITIDTLRTDRLSCYDPGQLKTPNIDTLADNGVFFTNAFAHTSTTLASHANILLGMTPPYHGVHDNLDFKVREEYLSMAELLKQSGYSTGAFLGAFPLDSRFGLSQGFDTYDDGDFWSTSSEAAGSSERSAGVVVDRALKWLDGCVSPWFAWVHCFDPHHPYEPPEPFRTEYKDAPYNGEVAYVDLELGRLFNYLRKNRELENTLVVFTADHGESLGQHGEKTHGCFAYNSTIRIPLLMSIPGVKPRIVHQNVSHIDLFPTVCDILKIKKPPTLQGTSLMPCVKGEKLKDRAIYFESLSPYYNFGWAPIRGFIQGELKFIDSPIPELYDLKKDFDETRNMAQKTELDGYRKTLNHTLQSLESSDSGKARRGADRETLEKMKSLGYIGGHQGEAKKTFGPEDDAKVLLPYHYRSEEALELKDKGKPAQGILLLKEVIAEKKNVSKAYSNLASIYSSQGRLDDAIQVLEMGLEFIPDSYMIFSGYMGYLSEAGRWDEIISVFDGAIFKQLEFDPYIWDLVGQAYLQKGNFEKALSFCEKAVSIDQKYSVSYSNLGSIHFGIFNSTANLEELRRASLNYEKALELNPDISAAHGGLGLIRMYEGNYDEAIHQLETALRLQPDMDHALYNLGMAFLKKGDRARALYCLAKFKNSPSYSSLSRVDKEKLEEYIEKCKDMLQKPGLFR
jgi:arylsulfatase A-like enzyme/Tfp pilus assembly protein PilF